MHTKKIAIYYCNVHVIGFPEGGEGGGPGIPGEMWGLCRDFDINTFLCSGGNVGKCGEIKVHSPHPWGKCAQDFVFAVFHETVETGDENVFSSG